MLPSKSITINIPVKDLVHIYTLYVRSILEFNCCVWHFSITMEERTLLERVQKTACKIILKQKYITYESALRELGLQNLDDRRLELCKRFAKKCVKGPPQIAEMFPRDNTRHSNQFSVTFARTDRLLHSAIPQMQRLLNNP